MKNLNKNVKPDPKPCFKGTVYKNHKRTQKSILIGHYHNHYFSFFFSRVTKNSWYFLHTKIKRTLTNVVIWCRAVLSTGLGDSQEIRSWSVPPLSSAIWPRLKTKVLGLLSRSIICPATNKRAAFMFLYSNQTF